MKKFKKRIEAIGLALGLIALTYGVFALVNWNYIPPQWGSFSQFAFGFIGVCSIIGIVNEFDY